MGLIGKKNDAVDVVDVVECNEIDGTKCKLTFGESVISKIVQMTIKDIDGILIMKSPSGTIFQRGGISGINVEVGETEVAVDLKLVIEFGKNAQEIYEEVKSKVEETVESMTGLRVVEMNVKIEDVLTTEEFKARMNQNTK